MDPTQYVIRGLLLVLWGLGTGTAAAEEAAAPPEPTEEPTAEPAEPRRSRRPRRRQSSAGAARPNYDQTERA